MPHPNCCHPLDLPDPEPEDAAPWVTSPNLARASRSLKQLAGIGILLWTGAAVAAVAVHPQTDNLAQLKQLLADRQWQAASKATWDMLAPDGRATSLQAGSCELLLEVDHLWTQASAGHFGFTVQGHVWQRLVAPSAAADGKLEDAEWSNRPNQAERSDRFRQRVGWDRYAPNSAAAHNSKGYFPSDQPLATGKTLTASCDQGACPGSPKQVEERVSGIVEVLPLLDRCLN